MQRIILISAYLSGAGQERKIAYLERLDKHLRRCNSKLFVVNTGPDPVKTTFERTTMPACIGFATRYYGPNYLEVSDLSEKIFEAAGVEAEVRNTNLLTGAMKVLFYRAFMRKILLERSPALCIIWHQFNALHIGLADLCDELGIPVIYGEYGVMPGTVCFEEGGQMGESWVARRSEYFAALPIDDHDLERADALIKLAKEGKRSRKDQSAEFSVDDIVDKARKKERKIIFYAGQNDAQSGLTPSWLPAARTHSPYYTDTLDALSHLSRLAESNDWQILFKPHPLIQEKHKNFEVPFPDRIDLAIGANIFECMEKTDLTTTILSQVAYLSLIHARPTALFGRMALAGKECVYEPATIDNVEETLRTALKEGLTEIQVANFRKHVAQLCRYYLFSFEEDIESIIGRGLDDANRYLVLQSQAPGSVSRTVTNPKKQRRFGEDYSGPLHLLKLRGLFRILYFFDIPVRQKIKTKSTGRFRFAVLCGKEIVRRIGLKLGPRKK